MAKLSRKAIREGLDQIPIDTVLLGTSQAKESPLTPKQREFARLVALGETKAGAYRKAYNSKGKPNTVGQKGYELSKRVEMQVMIDAFRLANEVEKQQTPAQLRRLVISQLTQHALDEDFPPAQRVKALELLGKVSEVAAFTERKETTVTHQSGDIKAKLLEQLKNVIDITPNQINDEEDADSLLLELQNGEVVDAENLLAETETHHTATPLNEPDVVEKYTHTIPHTESAPNSDPALPHPTDMETHPLVEGNGEGEGGIYIEKSDKEGR